MPRAAGYVARKCNATQLRAKSTAAVRVVVDMISTREVVMPRGAGYRPCDFAAILRGCRVFILWAAVLLYGPPKMIHTALRIVFGRSMPRPYGLFSAAACRGPTGFIWVD